MEVIGGIMSESVAHGIRIQYGGLDSYLVTSMGFDDTLNYILRKEAERRFGSVENFLRKIGLGKFVDEVKKQLGMD